MFKYNEWMSLLNRDDINARLKRSLQGSTPKLKCLITGMERVTSMDYLKTKEKKFGTIDNYVNNYISSDAVRLLKQKISIMDIKNTLNPDSSHMPDDAIVTEASKYYNV
jgi:hypothetical protein